MTRRVVVGACMVLCSLAESPAAEPVAADYQRPRITAPFMERAPDIDGVIEDAEWNTATSVTAMQTTDHAVSARQCRFWLAWDADTIYVAMRSPLRPGERIVQNLRDSTRDVNVVFDDSYELWLDAHSKSPDGQPVFFQYLANFAGTRFDVMHEPAVGNSRLGWTAGWQPANRLNDRNEWEMEVAIPRTSVYRHEPFTDGTTITMLLARNFKKPWEQNSFEGTSSFSVADTHTLVTLSRSAPALHLLRVADPTTGTFGLELAGVAARDTQARWTFASDGAPTRTGLLQLTAHAWSRAAEATVALDTIEPGQDAPGRVRIQITSPDGKDVWIDWAASRRFGNRKTLTLDKPDADDRVAVSLSLNPERDYLRVTGDFIDFAARDRIDHCDVVVRSRSGAVLAERSCRLDELAYVRDVIPLPDLPIGDHEAVLTVIGKDGKVVREVTQTFAKADPAERFPWWQTTAGSLDKPVPPWTPVEVRGCAIGVWGRTMTAGAVGLPAQVVSQGRPLLASPVVLQAELRDGSLVDAVGGTPVLRSHTPSRAVFEATGTCGSLRVASRVTVEFDGMYKVDLSLTPENPQTLTSLKVRVPLDPSIAEYVYGKGEGIRSGFSMGFLPPDRTGRIWDSLQVDSQPMVVGSFIPYVWVGDPKAGLCWFADSDRGWSPSAETPAVEIVRGPGSVDLVLNLISAAEIIDSPREITFAFQASPAKPLETGWRAHRWWCGHTFGWRGGCWVYPDGKGSTIWQSRPTTTNVELCRRRAVEVHAHGGLSVPYFEYNTMTDDGEQAYFGEEWKTSSGPLFYGRSLSDYIVWNLDRWIKTCDIDGWYLDNVRPVACDRIEAGRGYRLTDGRIQPEYNMFGMREFFLRLRAVFHENGKRSVIVNHMTNNMILPWNAAVDVAYDGEHHVIYPEMRKDFMDFWSLERLRTAVPETWGVNVNFMHEYQGRWQPDAKKRAMRAYTGAVLLHDALPTGNSATDASQRAVMQVRERFGIGGDDVRFIGYWQDGQGVACTTKDVRLAAWLRPGGVLVAVVNWGEATTADVGLNLAALGLPADAVVRDAEAPEREVAMSGGRCSVPVERHDFRLLELTTAAGGSP